MKPEQQAGPSRISPLHSLIMPVEQLNGRVVLKHQQVCIYGLVTRSVCDLKCVQGASAEILLYGATVISWKSATKANRDPVEHLFVSSKAALDVRAIYHHSLSTIHESHYFSGIETCSRGNPSCISMLRTPFSSSALQPFPAWFCKK